MAVLGVLALLVASAHADDDFKHVGQGISMHVSVRTVDQMTSFYFGRGFAPATVAEIAQACFITVGLRHQRKAPIWLEPASWQIVAANGRPVRRFDRQYWDARFAAAGAPAASRATFGWTLLPESRDLRADEPVGGNLTIEPPEGRFTLVMRFATGADKRGPDIVIRAPDLVCPRNGAPSS